MGVKFPTKKATDPPAPSGNCWSCKYWGDDAATRLDNPRHLDRKVGHWQGDDLVLYQKARMPCLNLHRAAYLGKVKQTSALNTCDQYAHARAERGAKLAQAWHQARKAQP